MTGGQTVLSGAIPGRKLLSALIAATRSSEKPIPAFLDFDRVEVATGFIPARSRDRVPRLTARQALPNVYPVVANLLPAVTEELDFFVRARGDALWSCELDGNDGVVLRPADRRT
jgi:hypothetical protein